MKRLGTLLALILILAMGSPSYANEAKAAYNRGVKAESQGQLDAAFEAFRQAYVLKPQEPKYAGAFLRARAAAAEYHLRNGMKLREELKLQEALAEFALATGIDPTNFASGQEAQRTTALIKKQA